MSTFIQLTINGILLGGMYAAMTLGFSVSWGVMRLINLAHGEFIMIGAYMAWLLAHPDRTEIGIRVGGQVIPMLSLLMILAWAALGFALSHLVFRSRLQSPVVRRVAGYGISLFVIGLLDAVWNGLNTPAIDPILAAPAVMIVMFGVGYVLQRGLFNRVLDAGHLTMLLVTFGVSVILQNGALVLFSADPRTTSLSYERGIPIAPDITVSPVRIIVFILSLILIGLLVGFIRYTSTGRAIRAAAQNKMAARLVGINVKETYAITFGVSIAITAGVGALMSGFTTLYPTMGDPLTLRAFAVTALGGLGKVEGALVGGMVLGITESYVGGYLNTGWQVAVAFLMLVVILLIRPQGLLGGLVAQEA